MTAKDMGNFSIHGFPPCERHTVKQNLSPAKVPVYLTFYLPISYPPRQSLQAWAWQRGNLNRITGDRCLKTMKRL